MNERLTRWQTDGKLNGILTKMRERNGYSFNTIVQYYLICYFSSIASTYFLFSWFYFQLIMI